MTATAPDVVVSPNEHGADAGRAGIRLRPAVVALLVGVGLIFRLWTVFHLGGTLDADEAVVGLQARHFPEEISAFYWGQAYGGSHEAMVAAVLFFLFGPSTLTLRLVPLVLSAVATLLCWRVARRLIGPGPGAVAALLFWLWPPAFVWWSVKLGSNYWAALVLALLALLILLRLRQRPAWTAWEAGVLGFVVGLAWWANPQTVYLIAPALLFAVVPARENWRVLPAAAAGALAGAFPWIAYNARNDWLSLHFPSGPAAGNGYFDHLEGLFRFALPMALGLREPFTREWVLGMVGAGVYLALLAGFAVLALRRPRALRLPLVIAAAFPLLYATSPMTWYVDQPRYVLFLAPAVCVLVAAFLRTRWLLATVLAVAVALTAAGIGEINARFLPRNYAPDVAVPADLRPLHQLLREERVEAAFADYWLAYRIMFETGERVTVTPVYTVRHREIDERVRNAERPAYVFVAGATPLARFLDLCRGRGIPVSVRQRGSFVLVQPGQRVLPEELPGGWVPAA